MSEPPKCWSHLRPTARKNHRCIECRGVIERGEKYSLFKGVWDSPSTYKTCLDCEKLRQDICAKIDCSEEYPAFGHLYEHVFAERVDSELISWFNSIRLKRRAPESLGRWMEDFAGKEEA